MLRTPFCDCFGLAHPIISAPFGDRWAGAALAGAVSAAGGLGLIGGQMSEESPDQADWLREQIRLVRAQTDRPFGVGFILPFLDAYGQADLPRVALDAGAPVIALSFGDPAPYAGAIHAAEAKLIVQVQTVAQAQRALAARVRALRGKGVGPGGEIGTFSLVPAVVDVAGEIPVAAAGGVGDGRGLAAALLLGAAGAWVGTRFVASPEFGGGQRLADEIVAAGTDDAIRTRVYDRVWSLPFPDGIAGRVLREPFIDAWRKREDELDARMGEARSQLDQLMTSQPEGEPIGLWAGHAAGLIHEIAPAGELVRRLAAEAEHVLRERSSRLVA